MTTGAVVVHYGDPELTTRAVRSLAERAKGVRIVVVDNDPDSGLDEWLPGPLRDVTIVSPGRNTGFTGGCNLGIEALSEVDAVFLLNNDAQLGGGALERLQTALDADPRLGAVVPKVRFDGRFHELRITAASTWRPGRGDARDLAWQPRRIEVDGVDVTDRCQLVEGFWEPGRGGRWAGKRALLRVPAVDEARSVRIELATPPGRVVELNVDGGPAVRVEPGVGWAELPLAGEPVAVLANVGNDRRPDGYGIDRGRFEVDRGQHDEPGLVPAWCGGAVLLRTDYLRDVGPFDDRLFLYYEDLDLSLRGAARGWRYAYEPGAVVDHRVGSSASSNATRSERLRERNRLLVLARHGGVGRLVVELVRFVAVTLSYVRREIVAPPLRGEAPCGWLTKVRGLALGGALVRLPGMLVSRVADARRRRSRPGMPPLA